MARRRYTKGEWRVVGPMIVDPDDVPTGNTVSHPPGETATMVYDSGLLDKEEPKENGETE
ncbi:MAG: hypothetical protein ACYTGN_01825 [Planctomycetota bacterium]|jgi:hypothetical protein